jgi:hypothetical protein
LTGIRAKKSLDKGNADGYKHVLVIWNDIVGKDDAWIDISEAKNMKPGRMISSGWLLKSTKEFIILSSSLDTQEGLAGNINAIPRCVIETIRPLPKI